MTDKEGNVQLKRLARAIAIFLGAFLLVGLSGINWQKALGFGPDEASISEVVSSVPQNGESVLSYAQHIIDSGQESLSDEFVREIGLPLGSRDVRAMSKVVGFVMDCDVSEAKESVEHIMYEKGWAPKPLGGMVGSVFEKSDGTLSWAMVTFSQVGEATSVVVRYS